MLDVKALCSAAAESAFPSDGSAMKPTILGSDDCGALATLSTSAPGSLLPADLQHAFERYPWIVHVQPCTLDRWHPPGREAPAPALGIRVDCYSATLGHWQMLLPVRDGTLQAPQAFSEVLASHPLQGWDYGRDVTPDAGRIDFAWALAGPPDEPVVHETPQGRILAQIAANESRIARNAELIKDIEEGRRAELSFLPIVAFDFAKHSAARDLEVIAELATGLINPESILSRLAAEEAALRISHCNQLLRQLPKVHVSKAALALNASPAEALAILDSLPPSDETLAAAYWLASFDHSRQGLSRALLAKRFKLSAKAFEERVRRSPLELGCECPACGAEANIAVDHFSIGKKTIAFGFHCPACGHREAHQRDGAWAQAPLHCPCAICVKRQREVAATHLPRVVIALEDAYRTTLGLSGQALRRATARLIAACPEASESDVDFDSRHPLVPTEWDNKHAVYVIRAHDKDTRVPEHFFSASIDLCPELRVGTLEEACLAIESLGPTGISYLEPFPRPDERYQTAFRDLPPSVELLLEGDQHAPSEVLAEWAEALGADGLLKAHRANFHPLILRPIGYVESTYSSSRQEEIPMPRDMVVWREIPEAEASLMVIRETIVAVGEVSDDKVASIEQAGFAPAAEHAARLLEASRRIEAPKAQALLRLLATGERPTADQIRGARDALKTLPEDSALFYATLMWNYSSMGTGSPKALLTSANLALFSSTIEQAARTAYSLKTTCSCRRCASSAAALTFWGANEYKGVWRVDCAACGHWDESPTYTHRYPERYCHCQGCANEASSLLKGKSAAALLSEMASYCVAASVTLSSSSPASIIAAEQDLVDLLEDVRYNDKGDKIRLHPTRATWKKLRFNHLVGLVRHVLPGYSFYMPDLEDLARLLASDGPILSSAAFRALQQLWENTETGYQREHLRFRLPLCLEMPIDNEPKIPARSRRATPSRSS